MPLPDPDGIEGKVWFFGRREGISPGKKRAFCSQSLPPQLKSHLGSSWQVPLKLRLHL